MLKDATPNEKTAAAVEEDELTRFAEAKRRVGKDANIIEDVRHSEVWWDGFREGQDNVAALLRRHGGLRERMEGGCFQGRQA